MNILELTVASDRIQRRSSAKVEPFTPFQKAAAIFTSPRSLFSFNLKSPSVLNQTGVFSLPPSAEEKYEVVPLTAGAKLNLSCVASSVCAVKTPPCLI